jgi:8-oxo-dGTP pyrophosphatase MutT (NUDIX family)
VTLLTDTDFETFAQPRVASGALYTDENGRIMLVNPTYKDLWDLPGGYLHPGETPSEALRREVVEELGVALPVGSLLVADWAPNDREGDKLLFVFDGGVLTDEQTASIRVDGVEIAEFAYHDRGDIDRLLIPRLARRVHAALDARANEETVYLEHGLKTQSMTG